MTFQKRQTHNNIDFPQRAEVREYAGFQLLSQPLFSFFCHTKNGMRKD